MPTIGILSAASPTPYIPYMDAIRKGLAEAGFVDGRHVAIEYRWAEGQFNRLPALAAELVNRPVALIMTSGGVPAALAAKAATSNLPRPAWDNSRRLDRGHDGAQIAGDIGIFYGKRVKIADLHIGRYHAGPFG